MKCISGKDKKITLVLKEKEEVTILLENSSCNVLTIISRNKKLIIKNEETKQEGVRNV